MLLRAARLSCWRTARRLPVPRSTWTTAYHATQSRVFTSHGSWRKQHAGPDAPAQGANNPSAAPASKPANATLAEKPKDTPNAKSAKKDLLSEKTVDNKEQRKADWAIMKEMAKYLWPKVSLGTAVARVATRLIKCIAGGLGHQATSWKCSVIIDWSKGLSLVRR